MSIAEDGPPGLDVEPDLSGPEIVADRQSILEKVKKRRDERDMDHAFFDVPGWDGDIQAWYETLDREDVEKMARRIRSRQTGQGKQSGTDADLDFLIKACKGVYVIDPDDEDVKIQIADGYDHEVLVSILEPKYPKGHPQEGEPVPIKNDREMLTYLLGWNGIALASHSARLARWMQDTSKPVEDPQ